MRFLLLTFTILPIFASAEEWEDLFNGKDLSGWKVNIHPEAFSVKGGILTAHAKDKKIKSHLFAVDEEGELRTFQDFELLIEARGEENSNSGVFFHTDYEIRDDKHHLKNGYELQLNSAEKEKRKTGSLYDVQDLSESVVDESEWFTIRIRVEGKHIQAWINEEQTVDYLEPENPERSPNRTGRVLKQGGGAIAIQGHDPGSVFHFRSIRIRPLS